MLRRFLVLTVAVAAFLSSDCIAQSLPYASGESYSITINFKWGVRSDIATVDLKLSEDGGIYHSVANIRTKKFFDGFYKVRDIYECKFKADNDVTPIWYHRDVKEGKYWAKGTYVWSADASELTSSVDKSTRPHRDTLYKEDQVIHDVLNLFHFVRAFNLGPDNPTVSRYLIVDRDIMEIRARYIADEVKKLPYRAGTYKARKLGIAIRMVTEGSDTNNIGLVLTSDMPEGKFGKESVFLWLSDDENRMPVFFTAPLSIGSINGVLTGYGGNKYEVTSKIATE